MAFKGISSITKYFRLTEVDILRFHWYIIDIKLENTIDVASISPQAAHIFISHISCPLFNPHMVVHSWLLLSRLIIIPLITVNSCEVTGLYFPMTYLFIFLLKMFKIHWSRFYI